MKFGIHLPHFGPLVSGEGTVALARRAEALGLDSVWVGDHLLYPVQFAERFGAEFYEAVTTLTYVAAVTSRIGIGTAVLILPYRNPVVLAKQLATLDALAPGRLMVGVGVGWMAEEYAAVGAPFAERGQATDESLQVMRALWTQERPAFSGRRFRFADVLFAPRAVQRRSPPIWVGGNSPRALRRAAELGDGWFPIWHAPTRRGFTPEALGEKIAELGELGGKAGRGIRYEVAGLMPLAILDRRPTAEETQPLVGPPDLLAEMLRRYREAGLGHAILSPYYGLTPERLPKTLAEVEKILERFVRDVRPHV
ncbi:MAG: LLM class F420-dependent oxidoreductase [Candidatus Methylomirabilia bacterium]